MRRPALCALAALALAAAGPARGQSACLPGSGAVSAPARGWAPPLDRAVSLHARNVSLRSALDRLSAASRVRLSYSADLLPLDRRVCASGDAVPVGQVLSELLRGTRVAPVVAGPDHVVLAPSREPAAPEPNPAPAGQTVALDRIVVTGSPTGSWQRSLPIALDVLDGRRLAERGTSRLSQALDGAVPGIWAWEQSPSSVLVRYGSIRGASSFGVSYPKVYIDGIEVANPLLVAQLTPDAVERVEVIRGPQGAALYGADAISGVVNIVTRHEGVEAGAPRARLRSGVGVSESDFAPRAALAQDHALTLRSGTTTRSLGLSVSGGTVGEFVPDASSRNLVAVGSARVVGPRSITTGTARFVAGEAAASGNPLLGDSAAAAPGGAPGEPQSVRQYTLGASSVVVQDDRWTHSVVVGVDGNRISGVPDHRTPPYPAGSLAPRLADGGADRGTLRASSVARFGRGGGASGGLSLAGEHSMLREIAAPDGPDPAAGPDGVIPGVPRARVEWRQSSALVAQGSAALRESLFLTGGVRLERNEGLTGGGQVATLPMLGAAWVRELGGATLKLRGAYGKGIRPARTAVRQTTWVGVRYLAADPSLAPEEQSGVEAGLDLLVGRAFSLQVTRYDQLASGLIQRVPFEQPEPVLYPHGGVRRIGYRLENVGEISNRGWEVQGSAEAGRLSLDGSFSLVDSRVRRVAAGYTGDLRPGDRMLEVPARTASLSASWLGAGWSGSLTAYRAWDWVNYDYLALARGSADPSRPSREPVGGELRAFWREYPGITHLRAGVAREVRTGLSIVLAGDNLLDRQVGEPDNVTVLPGRTVTLGLRAEF